MAPTLLFLIVVYAVTWVLCAVLRPFADNSLPIMLAWLLPTVWTPTIAAIALSAWQDGNVGVRRELSRIRYSKGTSEWLAVAMLFPACAVAASVFAARLAGESAPFSPANAIPIMIALQVVTGATGEELGWRGFLLTRLNARWSALRTAWVMGGLWAMWHIAGAFFPGTPLQIAPPVLFLLVIMCFGVFLALLFDRTRSVLPTMLAHLSLNIVLGLGGAQITSRVFWWTLLAGMSLGATVSSLALLKRQHELGRRAVPLAG
jgi:membrane protease YdiL (CAAX protease family)